MGSVLLWVVLLLVATTAPVLALRADRWGARRAARRGPLPVPVGPDDAWTFARRHGLSPADSRLLERALERGERVPDPRLRALGRERAQALLATDPRLRRPGRTAVVVGVLALSAVLVGEVVWFPHALGGLGGVVGGAVQASTAARRRRRLALAVQQNGEGALPAPRTHDGPASGWRPGRRARAPRPGGPGRPAGPSGPA